jgi:hypothetical protein
MALTSENSFSPATARERASGVEQQTIVRRNLMKPVLRHAAVAVAVLGSVGIATMPSFGQDRRSPTVSSPSQGLGLTAEQRATIVRAVDQEKDKITQPPAFQAKVGAEAPASIALYVLPDPALAAIPDGAHYQYTVVQNNVILVDPTTMRVVDVIH